MLKELATQHREIARLRFEGRSPVEISTLTGVAIGTVRGILADPLCKSAIQKLHDSADVNSIDVRKRLVQMNNKALNTLEECMDQDISMAVKLSASKDVLDRNGYVPHIKVDHTHLHLTPDELEGIKARASKCIDIAEDPTEDMLDYEVPEAEIAQAP